jgi:cytochrome c553
MKKAAGILAGLMLTAALGSANAADKTDPKGIAFFEKKIRPVLVKQCYQCHSSQTKKPKGGLLLDTKAGALKGGETGHAVVPGNLKDSLIIAAIKHTGDVSEMPPETAKLPDAVIADFEKWIRMGAPDPRDGKKRIVGPRKIDFKAARRFWAFQLPKKHPVPAVKNRSWPRTDIDRFLLAKMESDGIAPARDVDRATLIRRATFDLTGLPPTPQEVAAFLNDSSPNAFEKVVDRLLASKRFGERWGRHWLDVVRYAESTGKERNYPYAYAWRYRNYVIDSLNADKPYDRFIREQIAGDLLPAKSNEQLNEQAIATGFLALGPKSLNERNRLKFEMEVVDDQIDVTGRAVLALTLACARCHDHKFDPIPTTDYYALAGIYRSTQVLAGIRGRRARAGTSSGLVSLHSGKKGGNYDGYQEKLQEARQQLRRAVTRLARQGGANGKRKKARKKLNKKQLQRLINRMQEPVISRNDSPQVVRLKKAVQQAIREIKKLQKNAPPAPAMAMGVKDAGRAIDSKVFIKGEVTDQGETVPRGYVTAVWQPERAKMPADHSGRLQLADWLTSTKNPLIARVMVNRIWQHLFGTGLVKSVDNFGELGERPSHPQLLDYLAVDFMANGWSVKRAIKTQMLTRGYRLASEHSEKNYTLDPENRLVWRGGRRRLDAEAIRDAMLAVSGELDVQRPASSPLQNLGQGEIGRQLSAPSARGSKLRSVYLPVVRQAMPEMMRVFDVADPSLIVGEREVTTVPTQALFMMNNPFVIERSEAMAKRLLDEKGMDDSKRVAYAYQLALGRKPTKRETERVLKFLSSAGRNQQGWATFCQTLFASAEFRYLY